MFRQRIKELLSLLGVGSADLARLAGCDQSHISRMVSGARVPKNGGAGAWRLVNGVYLCADEKGMVNALCDLVSCGDRGDADAVRRAVMLYLYEGEAPRGAGAPREKTPYRAFGERLGAVMDLTGLSNIRLGKALNLDPSYVSRFRNGFRSPKANPKTMSDLCLFLLDRILEQGKEGELARLTGEPVEEFSDREKAAEILYLWLYSNDGGDSGPLVERLIDQIGFFSAKVKKPPLSFEAAADTEILADTAETYYGREGLRRAVIRFLGSVIRRGERELFLYSDQNMDWMVSDPLFRAKWATLMALSVAGGVKITIIHNINRDLSEMASAIESWLPLYPSGRIRSYYCKTPHRPRFSATLFLCPGCACIFGCNVIGAEDGTGMYRYDTDPAQLAAHGAAYRELLSRSGELVRVYRTSDLTYPERRDGSAFAVFGGALSLATMPEEVLRSALGRSGADEERKKYLLRLREERFAFLKRSAERGGFHEYAPVAPAEALSGGSVRMDLPELSVSYTPREYAAHVRRVIGISEELVGYRFYILPEAPFEDVKVLISDSAVAVSRLREPYLTFLFEHPDLCRAFLAYAARIRDQYSQDKLTTKRILERFL
ncbi:MAG: helix-turn-helix transcriptional regulator [Clostridia bacterium]|nr:helix-turn-helix transcriptional regulator [Clostridia bacterium]